MPVFVEIDSETRNFLAVLRDRVGCRTMSETIAEIARRLAEIERRAQTPDWWLAWEDYSAMGTAIGGPSFEAIEAALDELSRRIMSRRIAEVALKDVPEPPRQHDAPLSQPDFPATSGCGGSRNDFS